jgi:hypothetical protein
MLIIGNLLQPKPAMLSNSWMNGVFFQFLSFVSQAPQTYIYCFQILCFASQAVGPGPHPQQQIRPAKAGC